MNDDIIIITAEGPSTWLRERFTPSGVVRWLGEGLVSDYAEKMEILRQIDDRIYEWSKDLGAYLDLMESSFKAKRLIDLASVAVTINNTLKKVTDEEVNIKDISEEAITEFEKQRGELKPGFISNLKTLWRDPTTSPNLSEEEIADQMGRKASLNSDLVKEAGWWDDLTRSWVHNKLRSKKLQDRDVALKSFFVKTKSVVTRVRALCDNLHKFRAYGEIGKYLNVLREISKLQKEFNSQFNFIYKNYLAELVQSAIDAKQGTAEGEGSPSDSTAVDSAKTDSALQSISLFPEDSGLKGFAKDNDYKEIESGEEKDIGKCNCGSGRGYGICHGVDKIKYNAIKINFNKLDSELTYEDKTVLAGKYILQWNKEQKVRAEIPDLEASFMNHNEFIKKLASCSNQYEAANLILKYSQQLEEYDLEKSLKLLALSEGLLND